MDPGQARFIAQTLRSLADLIESDLQDDLSEFQTPAAVNEKEADPQPKKLYRVSEASNMLGLSVRTVYNLLASGELQSLQIGHSRRLTEDHIERFIGALDRRDAGSSNP